MIIKEGKKDCKRNGVRAMNEDTDMASTAHLFFRECIVQKKHNEKVRAALVLWVETEYEGHGRPWCVQRGMKRNLVEEIWNQGKRRLASWTGYRYQTRTLSPALPLAPLLFPPLPHPNYKKQCKFYCFQEFAFKSHKIHCDFVCQVCTWIWNVTVEPHFMRVEVSSIHGLQVL